MMSYGKIKNIVGKKFGRWTVISMNEKRAMNNDTRWDCVCECGEERVVARGNLVSGRSKSCGCYNRDNHTKHGQYKGESHGVKPYGAFISWKDILHRCFNPKLKRYDDYGGRGITVCDRWAKSYDAFLEDMGPRPIGKSIDRIDNNGDYEPGNCRWATRKQQNRNKRNNIYVQLGELNMIRADWIRLLGITVSKWEYRAKIGMSSKEIVEYHMR